MIINYNWRKLFAVYYKCRVEMLLWNINRLTNSVSIFGHKDNKKSLSLIHYLSKPNISLQIFCKTYVFVYVIFEVYTIKFNHLKS